MTWASAKKLLESAAGSGSGPWQPPKHGSVCLKYVFDAATKVNLGLKITQDPVLKEGFSKELRRITDDEFMINRKFKIDDGDGKRNPKNSQ